MHRLYLWRWLLFFVVFSACCWYSCQRFAFSLFSHSLYFCDSFFRCCRFHSIYLFIFTVDTSLSFTVVCSFVPFFYWLFFSIKLSMTNSVNVIDPTLFVCLFLFFFAFSLFLISKQHRLLRLFGIHKIKPNQNIIQMLVFQKKTKNDIKN